MGADVGVGLRAEGLGCTLGGRVVLDAVDLELAPGEVVGLLGPNGAGKTTLFRLLVGSLAPARGRVLLDGEDLTGLPLHRRALRGVGYLPQSPSAFAGLSAQQNIEAVVELRRELRGEAPAVQARRALARFGLEARADQRASTLSGGERRRLELARLFALRPRVLLLDEPFAGLDDDAAQLLRRQLGDLAGEGIGVLLADHRSEQTLTICHRACILIDGRIVARGTPEELVARSGAGAAEGDRGVGVLRSMAWH